MSKHRRKNKHLPHARLSAPAAVGTAVANDPDGEAWRGFAAFQRGEYGEAIQAWRRARRAGAPAAIERAVAEAHFRLALDAASEARRADELRQAIALAPTRAPYHFHLGLT